MVRYAQFVQSEGWARVMEAMGHAVIPFEDFYAYKKKMRFGFTHLFVPRIEVNETRLGEIEAAASRLKCDFIRIEPLNTMPDGSYQKIADHDPSHTIVIDLSKPEDELLKDMHAKTRYNVRLADRKGVRFVSGGLQHFEDFWDLIKDTYQRKNLTVFAKEHYREILENVDTSYIAFAEYEGKKIVANLMIEYGDTLTYLHGGSDKTYQNVMGAQYLQWKEIIEAKKRGLKYYDFWGIAPTDDTDHPWAGVTRFKKGFGGIEVEYPGTFEKGLTWKYPLYRVLSNFR